MSNNMSPIGNETDGASIVVEVTGLNESLERSKELVETLRRANLLAADLASTVKKLSLNLGDQF